METPTLLKEGTLNIKLLLFVLSSTFIWITGIYPDEAFKLSQSFGIGYSEVIDEEIRKYIDQFLGSIETLISKNLIAELKLEINQLDENKYSKVISQFSIGLRSLIELRNLEMTDFDN